MATYYYVEMEGMVFLRVKNGRLCFPESEDELDFELEEGKKAMRVEGNLIYFCKPKLTKPPQDWWHRDLIPLLDQADPIVRKAVNLSLPRVIVLGLILDRKGEGIKMLMVKSSRGYLIGQWSLPSGFVEYGESPEEAVVREVKEELGLEASIRSLLLAPSRIVDISKHFQIWLYYELDFSGEPNPNPEEIESFKWVDIDDVIEDLKERRPESTLRKALELVKLRAEGGSSMAIIGVDLGGTELRMGVVEVGSKGELELKGDVEKLSNPRRWEEFLQVLRDHKAKASNAEGYGIAIAGAIEGHAQVIKAPNLPWLDGRNMPEELAPHLGLDPKQIVVTNDMEAAAYGEKAKGVLKKYAWAIFDTISTGWGGALILNDKVVVGEPGHVNLGFDLPYVCGCGNRGCVEALYSGSAMERRILQQFQRQVEERKILFPPDLNVWDYFHKEIETGAEWTISLLEEWAEGVGRAWANVLNRIRPIQAIVYMGTTAEKLIPQAKDRIRATIRRICMFPEHKEIPIKRAIEPNRPIYGAVLVYQELQKMREKEGGDEP